MSDPSAHPGPTSRAGARRGTPAPRAFRPRLVLLGVGALVALVGWGFLVWSAIHFGRAARGGDSTDWWYLAAASVGAVACLFLALMLTTSVLRGFGVVAEKSPHRH